MNDNHWTITSLKTGDGVHTQQEPCREGVMTYRETGIESPFFDPDELVIVHKHTGSERRMKMSHGPNECLMKALCEQLHELAQRVEKLEEEPMEEDMAAEFITGQWIEKHEKDKCCVGIVQAVEDDRCKIQWRCDKHVHKLVEPMTALEPHNMSIMDVSADILREILSGERMRIAAQPIDEFGVPLDGPDIGDDWILRGQRVTPTAVMCGDAQVLVSTETACSTALVHAWNLESLDEEGT